MTDLLTLPGFEPCTCPCGCTSAGYKAPRCTACGPGPDCLRDPARHRLRWYVWSGGELIPRTAGMRGAWPGYDVRCSCGWQSRTGGGVRHWVRELAFDHLTDHGIVRVSLLTH